MRKSAVAPLVLAFALFLGLACPDLSSPGLNIDEAADGAIAGCIGRAGPPAYVPYANYNFVVGGRNFPVMQDFYLDALADYFLFPFVKLFGSTVFAIRIAAVSACLFLIAWVWAALRLCFGGKVAAIAAVLLASDLDFVQYGRLAFHREEIFVVALLWAALFCLVKFLSEGRRFHLFAGFLFLGAGLSFKITFAWYLPALALAWSLLPRRPAVGFRSAAAACAFFLLGAAPIVVYNLHSHFASLAYLWGCLFKLKPSGYPDATFKVQVDNLAYWSNLRLRIDHLRTFLSGAIILRRPWSAPGDSAFWPAFQAFHLVLSAASIIFFYAQALRGKGPRAWRAPARFFSLFYLVVFLETPFSVNGLHPGHLLVLIPLPQLAAAVLCVSIGRRLRSHPALRAALLGSILAPALALNAYANASWGGRMLADGGRGRWSTAIYSLARYLDEKKIRAPVSFGFAVDEDIVFLTRGRVVPIMCRDASSSSIEKSYREAAIEGGGKLFYLRVEKEERDEGRGARRGFELAARRRGAAIVLRKAFLNSSGRRVYRLYEVLPRAL